MKHILCAIASPLIMHSHRWLHPKESDFNSTISACLLDMGEAGAQIHAEKEGPASPDLPPYCRNHVWFCTLVSLSNLHLLHLISHPCRMPVNRVFTSVSSWQPRDVIKGLPFASSSLSNLPSSILCSQCLHSSEVCEMSQ